jgi:hypothetical protein
VRDYLNSQERKDLMYLKKSIDFAEQIITDWSKKNNLSKDESTNLKKTITWGCKAYNSILSRQNDKALKSYVNSMKQSNIALQDEYALTMYNRKLSANTDDDYERNRDYFRLIELIMHYNCRSCKKCHKDCDFYLEFEEHCVPEPDGTKENCRYAFCW